MAAKRSLSPRLASICADSDEIREAVVLNDIFTTQDLVAAGVDAETVAARLGLSVPARASFATVFACARARAECSDEERMQQMFDVLNGEGHLIMTRPRSEVHRKGFWHRAINVWVVCPSTSRVLLGQRAVSKDMDPDKWTCVCGRVPSGELSMTAAVEILAKQFDIQATPDDQISLAFSLRCPRDITKGLFAGQIDNAWIDTYVARLEEEIPLEHVHLDVSAKHAAKYISIKELEQAFAQNDSSYVIPANAEYCKKLNHYLKRLCAEA